MPNATAAALSLLSFLPLLPPSLSPAPADRYAPGRAAANRRRPTARSDSMDDAGHDGGDPGGDEIEAIGRPDGRPARKGGKASKASQALRDAPAHGGDVPAASSEAADRLRSLIERIERLEEERKTLGDDIKEVFAEAKSAGFDVKVIRQIIRIRRQEPSDVEEQESLLDVYRRALGM